MAATGAYALVHPSQLPPSPSPASRCRLPHDAMVALGVSAGEPVLVTLMAAHEALAGPSRPTASASDSDSGPDSGASPDAVDAVDAVDEDVAMAAAAARYNSRAERRRLLGTSALPAGFICMALGWPTHGSPGDAARRGVAFEASVQVPPEALPVDTRVAPRAGGRATSGGGGGGGGAADGAGPCVVAASIEWGVIARIEPLVGSAFGGQAASIELTICPQSGELPEVGGADGGGVARPPSPSPLPLPGPTVSVATNRMLKRGLRRTFACEGARVALPAHLTQENGPLVGHALQVTNITPSSADRSSSRSTPSPLRFDRFQAGVLAITSTTRVTIERRSALSSALPSSPSPTAESQSAQLSSTAASTPPLSAMGLQEHLKRVEQHRKRKRTGNVGEGEGGCGHGPDASLLGGQGRFRSEAYETLEEMLLFPLQLRAVAALGAASVLDIGNSIGNGDGAGDGGGGGGGGGDGGGGGGGGGGGAGGGGRGGGGEGGGGPAISRAGLLLSGPPGIGKTYAVKTVVEDLNVLCQPIGVHVRLFSLRGAEVLALGMGDAEAELRRTFAEAHAFSAVDSGDPTDHRTSSVHGRCSIIFLDELDALCPKRDAGGGGEGGGSAGVRCVAQLLTLMDGIQSSSMAATSGAAALGDSIVVVVGATNRPDSLDPALRRPGRFDREAALQPPDQDEREALLRTLMSSLPTGPDLSGDADGSDGGLRQLAAGCVGYVAADLAALCREAALCALRDHTLAQNQVAGSRSGSGSGTGSGDDSTSFVTADHFRRAMKLVGASALRNRWVSTPTLRWEDIGSYEKAKDQLRRALEWPQLHSDAYMHLGVVPPRGLLLYGPPGCSKTSLVKAAATSAGASFVALSAADLYSPLVGDAEAGVRRAFKLARASVPAILFFDEIDALVVDRGDGSGDGEGGGNSNSVEARVLSTFLNEMDGIRTVAADGVVVVAATNRPGTLDAALLRPGRLDTAIHIPAPDHSARLAILHVHTRRMPLAADVDFEALADATEHFTGAELEGLCREAALAALRTRSSADEFGAQNPEEAAEWDPKVTMAHFVDARAKSSPLLADPATRALYEEMKAE